MAQRKAKRESRYAYEGLNVVLRHDPDYTTEKQPDGTLERVELPGIYMLGVDIDGAFFPIGPIHGGSLANALEHAADAREADDEPDSDT